MPEKFPDVLPPNISDPQVSFGDNEIKLAFKVETSRLDGIVVATGDVFCTEQHNQIAVQIRSVQAGFVSLPIGPWMEEIAESLENIGISILWIETGKTTPLP